jgi:hypothetical protein
MRDAEIAKVLERWAGAAQLGRWLSEDCLPGARRYSVKHFSIEGPEQLMTSLYGPP